MEYLHSINPPKKYNRQTIKNSTFLVVRGCKIQRDYNGQISSVNYTSNSEEGRVVKLPTKTTKERITGVERERSFRYIRFFGSPSKVDGRFHSGPRRIGRSTGESGDTLPDLLLVQEGLSKTGKG